MCPENELDTQLGIDHAVEVVRSILDLPVGFAPAHLEKLLTRLGDRAAIALLKIYAPGDWSDSLRVRRALTVIETAMRAPHAIIGREDRRPDATRLVLRGVRELASAEDRALIDLTLQRLDEPRDTRG